MATTDSGPSECRRFSIRLPRPLWIGVATVTLIVVAALSAIALPIYRQQATIRDIQLLRGKTQSRQAGPRWLRDRLGYERAELLDKVFFVSLSDTAADDGIVARLNAFPDLEELSLSRSKVSDAGLSHLKRLTRLEWLGLAKTGLTDAGLIHLRELPNLRSLYVDDTQVTDEGLVHLK